MRAKPILLLGGACVVAVAAVHLVADLSTPHTPSVPGSRQQALLPTAEVREASGGEGRAPERAAARPRPAPTPPAAAPDAEPTPRERDRQLVARIDATLTERLRGERADPSWARETEAAISATVGHAAFAGLRLDAVKCGATLCRVSLHASEQVADVDAVLEELTTTQAFRHGGFVHFTAPRELTMYVARKGHPLPPAPRT